MLDLLTWSPAGLFLAILGVATVPFLGVLVILTLGLGALVAFAWAVVMGSYELAHAIGRWRKSAEGVQPVAVQVPVQVPRAGRIS